MKGEYTMLTQLIKRRKILLERESSIIDRRSEIFRTVDAAVATDELKKLNVEAKKLFDDWWDFQKEVMALPRWKQFVFNIRKDL